MKKIRSSIFETNSSSSHSITISSDTQTLLTKIDTPEEIEVGLGEFGWENEVYDNFHTKLDYICIDHGLITKDENINQNPKYLMLMEVLSERTNIKKLIFCFGSHSYNSDKPAGYIDHQSHGTSRDVFKSKDNLIKFLFNTNSLLITGNDND